MAVGCPIIIFSKIYTVSLKFKKSPMQWTLQQSLPVGEVSSHSTGSLKGVAFLSSGHWGQQSKQNYWPYHFSHNISFEFFYLINSEMQ